MKRSFHKASGVLQVASAVLFILVGGWFLWERLPLPALCFLLFAVVQIDRIVHSLYVVTDDTLILQRGRLLPVRSLPRSEIASVQVFRPSPLLFLIPRPQIAVIQLRHHPRPLLLTPDNPDAFAALLQRPLSQGLDSM